MTTIINASPSNGLVQTADGSGVMKLQSNGVTTNALAWVNFDGTLSGTITPRANYNVSSVTKNATGDYTLNFTNALADANYAAVGSANQAQSTALCDFSLRNTQTTSAVQVSTHQTDTFTRTDASIVAVHIFGN